MKQSTDTSIRVVTLVFQVLSATAGLSSIGAFIWLYRVFNTMSPIGALALGTAALSLAFAAVVFFMQANKRRARRCSTFLQPEKLMPSDAEDCVGRRDDLNKLLAACKRYPLVWLDGASGVGKSFLVRTRLVEDLEKGEFKVVSVQLTTDFDWVTGPTRMLGVALREAFPGQLAPLAIPGAVADTQQVMIAMRAAADLVRPKKLYVILDQFDEYQTGFPRQFIQDGANITVQELIRNQFWADLRTLLSDELVSVLVIGRSDTRFECLDLAPHQSRTLEPLDGACALPLLQALAQRANVCHPEWGFDEVKTELCTDLGSAVLPIEMELAFRALARMKPLTIERYRELGLEGLIGDYLDFMLVNLVAGQPFSYSEILAALSAFTATSAGALPVLSIGGARAKLPKRATDAEARKLLDALTERKLIRQLPAGEAGKPVWTLHHRHLSKPIQYLERKSGYFHRELEQAHTHYNDAPRLLRLVTATPPLRQQVRFLRARFKGRLRYGRHRAFAVLSVLRVLPYLLLGWGAYESGSFLWEQAVARQAFNQFNLTSDITDLEHAALADIVEQSEREHRYLLDVFFQSPYNLERFIANTDYITSAIVQKDASRGREVIRRTFATYCRLSALRPSSDATVMRACEQLAFDLDTVPGDFVVAYAARDPQRPNLQYLFSKVPSDDQSWLLEVLAQSAASNGVPPIVLARLVRSASVLPQAADHMAARIVADLDRQTSSSWRGTAVLFNAMSIQDDDKPAQTLRAYLRDKVAAPQPWHSSEYLDALRALVPYIERRTETPETFLGSVRAWTPSETGSDGRLKKALGFSVLAAWLAPRDVSEAAASLGQAADRLVNLTDEEASDLVALIGRFELPAVTAFLDTVLHEAGRQSGYRRELQPLPLPEERLVLAAATRLTSFGQATPAVTLARRLVEAGAMNATFGWRASAILMPCLDEPTRRWLVGLLVPMLEEADREQRASNYAISVALEASAVRAVARDLRPEERELAAKVLRHRLEGYARSERPDPTQASPDVEPSDVWAALNAVGFVPSDSFVKAVSTSLHNRLAPACGIVAGFAGRVEADSLVGEMLGYPLCSRRERDVIASEVAKVNNVRLGIETDGRFHSDRQLLQDYLASRGVAPGRRPSPAVLPSGAPR